MRNMSGFTRVLLVLLATAASPAGAADAATVPLKDELAKRIAAIEKDPATQQQAIEAGRGHALICAYCHGKDGNSSKPDIPNLAGQHASYLLDQIERFASGARRDYTTVMQQLSRQLKPEERLDLAVYYASIPLKPASADAELAKQGGTLYLGKCTQCHGIDGKGGEGYARISGQQPGYVAMTLKNFRDGKMRRESAIMTAMSQDLSDKQIEALAAFIANLR